MLPSTESLRCFVAAAKLLSFRRGARSVALTPAAFGARIQKLEEELGAPLFHRTTRVVELTTAGLALLPVAERCLAAAADCVRAARGEIGPPPMELTVGTREELGLSWVVPQLDQLRRRFSNVALNLYVGSGPDLLRGVRSMEIDLAITSARTQDGKLDGLRLHREDYVFVATPKLLAEAPLTRPEHAARHVLLDIDPELPLFRYFRDAQPEGDRFTFQRVAYLGGIGPVRARALAGAGVAVLPRYLVEPDLARKALRRLFPKAVVLHDYFRLVFRADDARRPFFTELAGALLEAPLR